MRLSRTLFLLLVSAVAACGPVQLPCDAQTCSGCCDSRGACQRGDGAAACGGQGLECRSCLLGQACVAGRCSQTGPGNGSAPTMTGGGGAGGAMAGGMTAGGAGGGAAGGRAGGQASTGGGGAAAGGGAAGGTSVESVVNRASCTGTGRVSGTIGGQMLATNAAQTQVTNYNAVSIKVYSSPLAPGGRALLIEFDAIANQLAYSVGETNCAIAEYTAAGWRGVELLAGCEVQFAQLSWASSAGVCNGTMVGQMAGIGSGNSPVAATFAVPVNFLMPQANRCHRSGGSCSTDADCCNHSCSRFIGVCN